MKKSIFNMELIILSSIIEKDCYGYEIASTIFKKSEGILDIKEGALYPILSRLKENGFVSNYEKVVNRKIRVYYHIEKSGILLYRNLEEEFYLKFKAVENILRGVESGEK
ncbi:MAG: PadR family transcriptional regulator [Coprobacillus sp.]